MSLLRRLITYSLTIYPSTVISKLKSLCWSQSRYPSGNWSRLISVLCEMACQSQTYAATPSTLWSLTILSPARTKLYHQLWIVMHLSLIRLWQKDRSSPGLIMRSRQLKGCAAELKGNGGKRYFVWISSTTKQRKIVQPLRWRKPDKSSTPTL